EVIGMRARESQAPDAANATHCAQQIGKVVLAVEVRIHRLAEQHYFRDSRCDCCFGFANNFRKLSTPFRTTSRRDNAVGAPVVAAALDRNPRLHSIKAPWSEILIMLFEIELNCR